MPLREVSFRRLNNKMVVIVHKTVCMAEEMEAFHGMIKEAKEVLSILIVSEYPLFPVCMIEGARVFYPERMSYE